MLDSVHHLHKFYMDLTLAFQRLSYELDYVRHNSVPYAQASQSIRRLESVAEVKVDDAQKKLSGLNEEIATLKRSLANAEAKLSDVEFLSSRFKDTFEYCDLADSSMAAGVKWAAECAHARHPDTDYEFLNLDYHEFVTRPKP